MGPPRSRTNVPDTLKSLRASSAIGPGMSPWAQSNSTCEPAAAAVSAMWSPPQGPNGTDGIVGLLPQAQLASTKNGTKRILFTTPFPCVRAAALGLRPRGIASDWLAQPHFQACTIRSAQRQFGPV